MILRGDKVDLDLENYIWIISEYKLAEGDEVQEVCDYFNKMAGLKETLMLRAAHLTGKRDVFSILGLKGHLPLLDQQIKSCYERMKRIRNKKLVMMVSYRDRINSYMNKIRNIAHQTSQLIALSKQAEKIVKKKKRGRPVKKVGYETLPMRFKG